MQFDLSTAIYARVPLSAFGRREIDPEPAPPSKPRGRRRVLSFQQRLEIAIRWREIHDGLARRGRSTRHPKLTPILKQIGRERAKNALPWRIEELSRKADRVGRFHSVPILPPDVKLPEVDRLVAKETGLTERMVRKVRSDKRITNLVGLPVWVLRDWEANAARSAWAMQQARRLLTPERLAKPIHIIQACGTIGIKELIEQDGSEPFRTGSELGVGGPAPPAARWGVFNEPPRERKDVDKIFKRNLAHWMEAKRVREAWEEEVISVKSAG
jgi:hypothetical protein